MEPVHSTTDRSPLANLEISEQALNTPRKRSDFLKGLMVAGAGVAAVAALGPAAGLASAQSSSAVAASDLDILNFALTLEHLEKAFYDLAVATVPFEQSTVRDLARTIQADESAHVTAITAAIKSLGGVPVAAAASYNFGLDTFKLTSTAEARRLQQPGQQLAAHGDVREPVIAEPGSPVPVDHALAGR